MPRPAIIVLEDGAAYRGEALTGQGAVGGEIVFNTSMAGYQEIATDPSYCGQLVTFTFPMNGNYGADAERDESVPNRRQTIAKLFRAWASFGSLSTMARNTRLNPTVSRCPV